MLNVNLCGIELENPLMLAAGILGSHASSMNLVLDAGAGAVVRTNVPPYSIVTGNPAKVVGFSLKPEEVIEHEKTLYPEEERLPLDKLEKNYKKYFLNRLMDIRNFTSL